MYFTQLPACAWKTPHGGPDSYNIIQIFRIVEVYPQPFMVYRQSIWALTLEEGDWRCGWFLRQILVFLVLAAHIFGSAESHTTL